MNKLYIHSCRFFRCWFLRQNKFAQVIIYIYMRVNVPITADRKSRRLLKLKKNILRWKSRRELIFKAVFGIK